MIVRSPMLQWGALLLSLIAFSLCVDWGLPSSDVDSILSGGRAIWTGAHILELSQSQSDPNRASDVDANPPDRSRPIVVNESDAQRAEIIRRYRLFTHQPDEMQTLMALAEMKPAQGDFDPRMYKYGGLWVYPVGAMLKFASMFGWIDLRSDPAFYLDHPDAFARFYIVARLYTVMWAMIGVWAVMWMARRLSPIASGEKGPCVISLVAGVCFIFMPVVLNMAHEAKPHLPGAVLVLLASIAGLKYLDTSRARWLWLSGALCGAAVGMVLSAWVAFTVLIAIAIIRREVVPILIATAIGGLVYVITNPYVAINLIANPAVVKSNLANSAAFYHIAWDAFPNAAMLVRIGMSSVLAIAGVIGTVILVRCRQGALMLVAAPALAAGAAFFLFASGQSPDYARFALTLDIAMLIAAIVAIGRIHSPAPRAALVCILLLTTMAAGGKMLLGFLRDRGPETSRLVAAHEIERWRQTGLRRLVIFDEPAPYCLPPVDLWHWQIILMPRGATLDEARRHGDLIVAVDPHSVHPISWADKRFVIISGWELDTRSGM